MKTIEKVFKSFKALTIKFQPNEHVIILLLFAYIHINVMFVKIFFCQKALVVSRISTL